MAVHDTPKNSNQFLLCLTEQLRRRYLAFDWPHLHQSFDTAAEKNSRQYETATMDKDMSHFQSHTHTRADSAAVSTKVED